jgi:hypothetical protein
VIDDRIVVVGGEEPEGTFDIVEAYDTRKSNWSLLPPLPTARHGLGASIVDGKLYVIAGGPSPGGSYSSLNEVLVPAAD